MTVPGAGGVVIKQISFEIEGTLAKLRCVGNHNDIDRTP